MKKVVVPVIAVLLILFSSQYGHPESKECYEVVGTPRIFAKFNVRPPNIELSVRMGDEVITRYIELDELTIRSNSDLSPHPKQYSYSNTLVCVTVNELAWRRAAAVHDVSVYVPPVLLDDWRGLAESIQLNYRKYLRSYLLERKVPVPVPAWGHQDK